MMPHTAQEHVPQKGVPGVQGARVLPQCWLYGNNKQKNVLHCKNQQNLRITVNMGGDSILVLLVASMSKAVCACAHTDLPGVSFFVIVDKK